MVQAVIHISDHTNRIINIVKAKYGFKDKNQAIEYIIEEYESKFLEPELRPEYIEKIKKRQKEETIKIRDLRKHFGLE